MGKKLQAAEVRKVKEQLIQKYGAKCSWPGCNKDFTKNTNKQKLFNLLILDHIDNNPYNNQMYNYQLLCREHNKKKNPSKIISACRQKNLSLLYIYENTESRAVLTESLRIDSIAMAKHLYGDNAFRTFVREEVFKEPVKGALYDELITSGIEVARLRKAVLEEKLEGMTSSKGEYYSYEANYGEGKKKYIKFRDPNKLTLTDYQNKYNQ